jgi:hypothetical protein
MGAASEWLEKYYGGSIQEQETTVNTVGQPVEAVKNDPDALAIVFVNFDQFDIFLTLAQNAPQGSGIILKANGGIAAFAVRDDLTLPTRAWYASSIAGGSQLYVLRMRREVKSQEIEGR